MLDCTTAPTSDSLTIADSLAVYELSDADLDFVGAGKHSHASYGGSLTSPVQISFGNIAIGVQVNNQVNIAVLSYGVFQGGSQTNINNAGNLSL